MTGAEIVSNVLSFEDARRAVERQAALVQPPATESSDLADAAERVLADSVVADRDLPPFPRSTRDGYAVRSVDLRKLPTILEVIGEVKAGGKPEKIPIGLGTGQAVSIMTGAPVPAGGDAVVMVEYTSQRGTKVEVTRGVVAGENIVPRGRGAGHGHYGGA